MTASKDVPAALKLKGCVLTCKACPLVLVIGLSLAFCKKRPRAVIVKSLSSVGFESGVSPPAVVGCLFASGIWGGAWTTVIGIETVPCGVLRLSAYGPGVVSSATFMTAWKVVLVPASPLIFMWSGSLAV